MFMHINSRSLLVYANQEIFTETLQVKSKVSNYSPIMSWLGILRIQTNSRLVIILSTFFVFPQTPEKNLQLLDALPCFLSWPGV